MALGKHARANVKSLKKARMFSQNNMKEYIHKNMESKFTVTWRQETHAK